MFFSQGEGRAKYRFVLLSSTLIPIACILALFVFYKLVVCFELHVVQKQLNDQGAQKAAISSIQQWFTSVLIFYLFIIYPTVSAALFNFFNYDELELPEGEEYWTW